jgi:hypothetical protein
MLIVTSNFLLDFAACNLVLASKNDLAYCGTELTSVNDTLMVKLVSMFRLSRYLFLY